MNIRRFMTATVATLGMALFVPVTVFAETTEGGKGEGVEHFGFCYVCRSTCGRQTWKYY
jgi:hypothetical protein